MNQPTRLTMEQVYPTKKARDAADKMFDALRDLDMSLIDAIKIWEEAYFAAGGKVGKRVVT